MARRRLHRDGFARPARRDERARVERRRDAPCSGAGPPADGDYPRRDDSQVAITLAVRPQVRPAQEATLALGGASALAEPETTAVSTLEFELADVPSGPQWIRLTVDGVESLLVDRSAEPPAFDPSQSVTVPA